MQMRWIRISQLQRHSGRLSLIAAKIVALAIALMVVDGNSPALSLPSFARQTGQPCGTCHTDFPALTPFGRRFKLMGYTTGGGEYQTTPFSSKGARDARAELDKLRGYAQSTLSQDSAEQPKGWVPPISFMAVTGFTHTQVPSVAPPTDPYSANDNFVLSQFSGFWGGAITDHVGAFVQVTRSAPDPASAFSGTPSDQFKHTWSWDNADFRYARTASVGPLDLVFGITANNNPSVQDLWNTTPAWSFPYVSSSLANTPGASTVLEGTFAQRVGGIGTYAMINDLLYLELTAYKTLGFNAQNSLGLNPFDGPGLVGRVAPYWRVALEPHWGRHSLMVGTFGMYSEIHPWLDPTFAAGSTAVDTLADRFTDIGFDSQYQYQGDNFWFTLRGSFIREYQRLDSTWASTTAAFNADPVNNPLPSNPTNVLNSLKLQSSLAFGADNRVVLTGQYFNVWGTADPNRYGVDANGLALTPNSNGWIAEIAYIPFGASKSPLWPWSNARIGLQYTYYNKFNGTTVGAQDNNTLFLHAWFAF
ncbi:putative cytochrome c family protein [Bradyrhizobium sp. ORS 278]|nr:putative cytochrome c family protein [Bradyrhizobium sp. ORS 278]